MEGSIKKHRLYSRQKSTQVNLKQILKKVRYPAIFLGAFYTIVGIFIPQHLVGPLFPTNTSSRNKSSQNHHPDIKTSLYTNHLIPLLATATAALPGVQQNTSCRPQPLPKYPDCSGQPGLTGRRLAEPRKIVLMILFAFEVDTLEIALKEQQDMVDKIFIVESSVSHKGVRKPLMWERLKFMERFLFAESDKIVHVVADTPENTEDYEWWVEDWQTDIGVARVREWFRKTGELQDEDIFVSANVDEVLSREALHKLRWCETSSDILSGALWVPMGNLEKALRPHYPVVGKPHAFSMPTLYKWRIVRENQSVGSRLFNMSSSGQFVSGGIHMTNSAFLPTALLKELTATEDDFYSGFINTDFLFSMTAEELDTEQDRLYRMDYQQCMAQLLDKKEDAQDTEQYVPWFLGCNQKRFPYWFGKHDFRNKQMLESITALKQKLGWTSKKKAKKQLFIRTYKLHPKDRNTCIVYEYGKPVSLIKYEIFTKEETIIMKTR